VSAATTLVLVRHGETPANLERVWHGSTDTPLSERGRAQARHVAERLAASEPRPSFLYTSPLQRAVHTAREIGGVLGLAPQVDAELSEYALGSWEGRSYRELLEREDFWGRIARDPDFAPEGGESVRQVAERFARAVRRIAAGHAGARGVVVSHGGAMALGLGWLLDARHASWKRVMRNCAVTELVFDPQPHLACFDDASHLDALGGVDPRDLRGES
jgi:broad specificity phosphatase PhoE